MEERTVTEHQLAQLLGQAEAAHGEYEQGLGHRDDDWPAWYASYIVKQLPATGAPGSA